MEMVFFLMNYRGIPLVPKQQVPNEKKVRIIKKKKKKNPSPISRLKMGAMKIGVVHFNSRN